MVWNSQAEAGRRTPSVRSEVLCYVVQQIPK